MLTRPGGRVAAVRPPGNDSLSLLPTGSGPCAIFLG